MTAFRKDFTQVDGAEERDSLLEIIKAADAGLVSASLGYTGYTYENFEEEPYIQEVFHKPARNYYQEEFLLTVQLRVPAYMKSDPTLTLVQPLIDASIEGEAARVRAERKAERAQLLERQAELAAELAELDKQLAE